MRSAYSLFLVVVVGLALGACDDSGEAIADDDQPNSASSSNSSSASSPSGLSPSGQRVVIVDRGMNMAIGAIKAPTGWEVYQDIATDLSTAQYSRYVLDLKGPLGVIRGLGLVTYNRAFGQEFEGIAESMARAGLQGFDGVEFGQIETNNRRMAQPQFQKAIQQARSMGLDLQAVQASFKATSGGRPVAGRVEVDHSIFYNQGQHTGGMVSVGLLISEPDHLAGLTRLSDAIGQAFEPNPAYDGARSKVIDAVSRRSQAEHQQRMANNQAQFNAHQKMMQSRYDAADQRNAQWLQDFRGSGTTGSSGSDYSGHDRFIDSINETTSFDDPDSGQRKTLDGQYDRWATDGLGNYIGSDNPSFDPNAYDGNFQEIEPLN